MRRRGGECGCDVLRLSHIEKLAFSAQCPRRELNFLPAQRKGGVAHVVQGRNPDEARHHLLEQLEPFPFGVRVDRRQPGDVPAWTGEADRKPGADYIADRCHHDGNCSGRIPRSARGLKRWVNSSVFWD